MAGEYVLGNLGARASRRFDQLLKKGDPQLQREVEAWRRRMDLLAVPAPLQPPGMVWARIDHDLDRADQRVCLIADRRPSRRKKSNRLWQAWSAVATAASLYLAVLIVGRQEQAVQPVPTMAATEAAFEAGFARAQAVRTSSNSEKTSATSDYRGYMGMVSLPNEPARWKVSVDLDSRMLRVESLGVAALNPDEDYQLWWVSDEEILSVGLLPRDGKWEVGLPRHLRLTDFSRLAITREPTYGSPADDGPTGPVLMNASMRPPG
ncbi:MAG: anti-sigma factor [Panacagrimonas sp.]